MYKITTETAVLLKGKTYTKDIEFNPVQDINGEWFISEQEVNKNTNWRYKELLANLKLEEYVAPKSYINHNVSDNNFNS